MAELRNLHTYHTVLPTPRKCSFEFISPERYVVPKAPSTQASSSSLTSSSSTSSSSTSSSTSSVLPLVSNSVVSSLPSSPIASHLPVSSSSSPMMSMPFSSFHTYDSSHRLAETCAQKLRPLSSEKFSSSLFSLLNATTASQSDDEHVFISKNLPVTSNKPVLISFFHHNGSSSPNCFSMDLALSNQFKMNSFTTSSSASCSSLLQFSKDIRIASNNECLKTTSFWSNEAEKTTESPEASSKHQLQNSTLAKTTSLCNNNNTIHNAVSQKDDKIFDLENIAGFERFLFACLEQVNSKFNSINSTDVSNTAGPSTALCCESNENNVLDSKKNSGVASKKFFSSKKRLRMETYESIEDLHNLCSSSFVKMPSDSTYPLSQNEASILSPCQGVCWDPTHQRWVAHWSDSKTHQRIRKYFNPKILGFNYAKLIAVLTRKEAVDSGRASMSMKSRKKI